MALHAVAQATASTVLLAAAALVVIPFPVLLLRASGRRFDVVEPVWLGAAVFAFAYALVPALAVFDPEPFESLPGYLRLSPPHVVLAVWLGGAGYMAFCLGYFCGPGARFARLGEGTRQPPDWRTVLFTGLVLAIPGLLAVELTMALVGIDRLTPHNVASQELRTAVLAAAEGRGYLSIGYLALALSLGCAMYSAGIRAVGSGARERRTALCVTVGSLILAVGLFAGLLGSRSLFIMTVGLAVATMHHTAFPLSSRTGILAALGLGLFGTLFISLRNSGGLTLDPVLLAGYAGKTFDGFSFLATALARVHDFEWGATLFEDLIYTYLPRSLFPDKPTVYGVVAAQDLILGKVAGSGTYPPGILAEGWLNFGAVGALFLPAATGVLLRTVHERVVRGGGLGAILLLGYILGNQAGLMRGFGAVVPAVVVVMALSMTAFAVASTLARRPTRPLSVLVFPVLGLALALTIPVATEKAVVDDLTTRSGGLQPGSPAPLDGGPGRLRRASRPGVVVFWSSWCEDCPRQISELAAATKVRDVAVLSVVYQDDPAAARRARLAAGAAWSDVPDDGRLTLKRFRATELPTLVLLSEGDVACQLIGLSSRQAIVAALDRVKRTGQCT